MHIWFLLTTIICLESLSEQLHNGLKKGRLSNTVAVTQPLHLQSKKGQYSGQLDRFMAIYLQHLQWMKYLYKYRKTADYRFVRLVAWNFFVLLVNNRRCRALNSIIFKNSVPSSQRTHQVSITKINR